MRITRFLRRTSLLAVVGTTALGGSGASASVAPCESPGGERSSDIARADRPDGRSEVTEYLPNGAYRVTVCGRGGGLAISQTVAPVQDPDGGTTMVPIARTEPEFEFQVLAGDPSDPVWAEDFRRHRAELKGSVIPPTPRQGGGGGSGSQPGGTPPGEQQQDGPTTLAAPGDSCTNGQYSLKGGGWAGRYFSYRINLGSFGNNDATRAAMVAGHHNWMFTRNDCGFGDQNNITADYAGSTSQGAHSYADGTSVVDRGNMSNLGCGGFIACAYTFPSGASSYTETDQRFGDSYNWSNTGASNAYDYEAVATHETGHSIGLAHANSSSYLSMYYQTFQGDLNQRTLARGDVLGMRAIYP